MSKEEQRGSPPSLRDYWNNPTGFLPTASAHRPGREKSFQSAATPSLWEATVQPASPPLLPAETTGKAGGTLATFAALPDAASPTKRLYERVEQRGVSTLPTDDLLSLVLRTGAGSEAVEQRIQTLLSGYSLHQLLHVEFGELSEQHGLGKAKAAQLQAMLEVWRRLTLPPEKETYQIRAPVDAAELVRPDMEHLDHEEMRVLLLNTKNHVTANLLLYRGTTNSSVLRAAEIFRPAVARNCPNVIVCHNHPSGDPTPSPEDIETTKQLLEAGRFLDIDLLDHIIIGDNHRFTSLKERLRW